MDLAAKVVAGTFTAIFLYLFIFKADESSKVIKAFAGGYVSGVQALQGR